MFEPWLTQDLQLHHIHSQSWIKFKCTLYYSLQVRAKVGAQLIEQSFAHRCHFELWCEGKQGQRSLVKNKVLLLSVMQSYCNTRQLQSNKSDRGNYIRSLYSAWYAHPTDPLRWPHFRGPHFRCSMLLCFLSQIFCLLFEKVLEWFEKWGSNRTRTPINNYESSYQTTRPARDELPETWF